MVLFSFDELMGYAKKRAVRELKEAFEEFSMEEILENVDKWECIFDWDGELISSKT